MVHAPGVPVSASATGTKLYVLYRKPMAFEDLRWTEWIIHRHLAPWHKRGEWFDVCPVAEPYGWGRVPVPEATGDIPGCTSWRLGSEDHHLVRMRRLTRKEPRQFDAVCACGVVITGDPGLGLPSVQRRFALEHLHLAPTDAAVRNLTGRAGGVIDNPAEGTAASPVTT